MAKKSAKKTTKKASKKAPKLLSKAFLIKLFKFSFKWGMVVALWVSIIIGGILLWYASELPNITKSMVFERRPTIIIKASNGKIIDRHGDLKGEIVDVKTLPPHITNAILATEDRRFYSHFGMDLKGFTRALVVNISRGGFIQGGSTITQQLAKNLFLSRERTLKRKIQELVLSFQLEYELTKDEILSAYLNRVYLGNGAYGIDAASRVYFNKSAQELNIREAATIAGLLKAPSRYAPSSNPELSAKRTKVVMQAMVDVGYITDEDLQSYADLPPTPRRKPSSGSSVRYFSDYIVSQLEDLIGPIEQDIIVETTLNQEIQTQMEESITKAILRYGPQNEVGQAAGLFTRLDGAIVAMMGGINYQNSEFNRTTHAIRQPGSSFKPFVYLAALENGWNLYSRIEDKKITTGQYKPKNTGGRYHGVVTLDKALTLSLNTVAVQLMRVVGVSNVIDMSRRLGITADLEPNLSTALGSSGVPMIQMVNAYTILGRGGSAVDTYSIQRILNKGDEVLYQRTEPTTERQIVEKNNVAQINHMMKSVITNGTGKAATLPYPAAGKTGTTQDYRDAWFVGFTNKYAGAIWFGNDDNSPTKKLTGGSAPARVWKEVMLKAQTRGGKSYETFPAVKGYDGQQFDEMLDSMLGDSDNPPLSNGSWFDNIFNNNHLQKQPKQQAPEPPQEIKSKGTVLNQGKLKPKAPKTAPKKEFTPRGRHQWDMNE